jgi:putative inorganic carbon (hco3(-)) transporter
MIMDMERLAFTGGFPSRVDPSRVDSSRIDEDANGEAVPDASRAESAGVSEGEVDVLAFRGLLAFTLVLFFRPQDSLPFLEPLHLAELTATFALIALAAGRLSRGATLTRLTPTLILVLALGGVMLATAPFSLWPGGAVFVFTDLYSKVLLVFALMVNTVTTRARFERLVTVIVLGTSYVAVRAVTDYVRGVNLIEGGRVSGAVGGLFGNPNDMALNMVTFLPLAVAVALIRGRPLIRVLALGAVPAIAAAITFSQSRGGVLGLVAMLVTLLYQLRRIHPGVTVLVLVASLSVIPTLPSSFTERMSSIFNPDEDPTGSREARKRAMREGYQAFLDNPLVGIGAGQFVNYQPDQREEAWRETHNAALQVASELGILGLVVFVLMVGSGFGAVLRGKSALRRMARPPPPSDPGSRRDLELFGAALVASLAGWLTAAMFASVAYYWTFYLILGLATSFGEISLRHAAEGAGPYRRPLSAEAA